MAVPKRKTVLVDSDAFVALAKTYDTNHKVAIDALEHLEQLSINLLTTNYIFSESITVISQRVSHEAALKFITAVKQPLSAVSTIWINEDLEADAIDIFERQTSKNVSFVDCTNMAVMNALHVNAIFSFDKIYRKKGYKTVSDL